MIPNGAGLVWAHGGGFAGGDLDMPEADGVARALAARGITVRLGRLRARADARRLGRIARLAGEGWCALPRGIRRRHRRVPLGARVASSSPGAVGARRSERGRQSGDRRHPAPDRRRRRPLPSLVVLAYPTLLAVQPDAGCRAPGRARRRPRGRHVRPRRRARNVRELPRRAGRRRSARRDPGTGDPRRPRALPADAHDQRRGRRTPRLGRALRAHPRRRRTRHRRRSPSPAPGTATSTVPTCPRHRGIHRSHRRPPRHPPSQPLEPSSRCASPPAHAAESVDSSSDASTRASVNLPTEGSLS